MTMHLAHPSLSTTGKKKGKRKFASAEAKRRAEALDASWTELKKSYGITAEDKRRKRAMEAAPLTSTYSLKPPPGRETTQHIKSLGQDNGVATMAAPKVYTGTKVKGIATMHKSNAVPVFSDEEAVEISRMRRG
jgi:hypothetical protein